MKLWALKTIMLLVAVSFCQLAYSSNDDDDEKHHKKIKFKDNVVTKLDLLLEKLETIEAKLGCDMTSFLAGNCDENPASASASFCISQGRAAELGLSYAIEAPTTWEGGLGWAEVGDFKATISPVHPTVLFAPIGAPIPIAVLPNSVGIDAGGSLGRGMDICVEIPIVLTREDTLRLEHLAIDMNTPSVLATTKFQRRAGRILNYAEIRAAPNQILDRADTAITNLLDNGWESPLDGDNGFSVFRDSKVTELLAVMELPKGVPSILSAPEQIFDTLPDVSQIDQLTCSDFGATGSVRASRPRLDKLCTRLETLPSFDKVKDGLELLADIPDELIEAITEIMEPLLLDSPIAENKATTRTRFCNTTAGQRRAFNRLCGR
jgi:hypothetical protein